MTRSLRLPSIAAAVMEMKFLPPTRGGSKDIPSRPGSDMSVATLFQIAHGYVTATSKRDTGYITAQIFEVALCNGVLVILVPEIAADLCRVVPPTPDRRTTPAARYRCIKDV